ncbi:hypothetical protein DEVEQU_00252 [Devosia equisanguinis]|uniref:Uncharacterized protein n=1 Tax=Devosia equisanguinis TaxID=2490941 RepID=A0A3S5D357_9HYPH|nr:hypothetical protein [Devosia equisanguinis]VDS03132.1 hypothetical protein DEVEQU_00252 [Devosia equisanguinis]
MTKSIPIALGLVLALSAPALAALAPQYQRQAELEAVLSTAVEIFGIARPVDAVRFVDTDNYEAEAEGCTLALRIVDAPQKQAEGWVGPRQFTVEAGEPVCP